MNEAIRRIAKRAAALAETDVEKAMSVSEAVALEAMARCRREDIPPLMEAVAANIAADILMGADAEAVTEGDIRVDFGSASPWEKHAAALYSFRRLA